MTEELLSAMAGLLRAKIEAHYGKPGRYREGAVSVTGEKYVPIALGTHDLTLVGIATFLDCCVRMVTTRPWRGVLYWRIKPELWVVGSFLPDFDCHEGGPIPYAGNTTLRFYCRLLVSDKKPLRQVKRSSGRK